MASDIFEGGKALLNIPMHTGQWRRGRSNLTINFTKRHPQRITDVHHNVAANIRAFAFVAAYHKYVLMWAN